MGLSPPGWRDGKGPVFVQNGPRSRLPTRLRRGNPPPAPAEPHITDTLSSAIRHNHGWPQRRPVPYRTADFLNRPPQKRGSPQGLPLRHSACQRVIEASASTPARSRDGVRENSRAVVNDNLRAKAARLWGRTIHIIRPLLDIKRLAVSSPFSFLLALSLCDNFKSGRDNPFSPHAPLTFPAHSLSYFPCLKWLRVPKKTNGVMRLSDNLAWLIDERKNAFMDRPPALRVRFWATRVRAPIVKERTSVVKRRVPIAKGRPFIARRRNRLHVSTRRAGELRG
jgi:hypothetical protein